jgi:hypothetical protein
MKLQVLFDEDGRVIGTAQPESEAAKPTGTDAPTEVRLVPGPGQQLAEVDLKDDDIDIKDAVALHARLRRDLGR